ncbi:MAG: sigma-70 family RNA polymerase sigma factor [Bacteroidales bacterium]|nr:sigma-70 family RNA polymerase sigma factor [Bacteroidales bacterium]
MLTYEQEQKIVQEILTGDKEKYSIIVREYQETVANLCYRLVGNKLDVDEVTQQVFVELYTALPRFRHESLLSTFIYRITVNVVSKMLKHEKRFVTYDTTLEPDNDYQHSREEQLMKEEQIRRLHQAIGQLKHEQRTALVLHAFKDFSYNEIAEVMQVSLSKVESLIFRAKKNLQKMMTQ